MPGFISYSLCFLFIISLSTILYFTYPFNLPWSEPIEDGDYDEDDNSQDEDEIESEIVFIPDPVEAHERRAQGLDEVAMTDSHVDVEDSTLDTSSEDIEAPAIPQYADYTQGPYPPSPPPPYTPPALSNKHNPILQQALKHHRWASYYPLSPRFFAHSNYATPTPTPQVYHHPTPVAPRPAPDLPPLTSYLEILQNIVESMPPLPVVHWSPFLENFIMSNEFQQRETIVDHTTKIPEVTQSHSASTSQAEKEKPAKLDDLPPQKEQQPEPVSTPSSDLQDKDHDMDNEVMGEPEDADIKPHTLDYMDIRPDTNMTPAPWVHTPPPCPPARPRLWAGSKPRAPVLAYYEQPELMQNINKLMDLDRRLQIATTGFARQSLISMGQQLLRQILEDIRALEIQNRPTTLEIQYVNSVRFWTETIPNVQNQYPSQPAAPSTSPQEAARGSTSSEDPDEARAQSTASFFDAVFGTRDGRRGSGGDALPYAAAESRGAKETMYNELSYTSEERDAWKVAIEAKDSMDASLKACSFRDAACPSHTMPSTFDPSTSSGLSGYRPAANGVFQHMAHKDAPQKGSEADLVFRTRHEFLLDGRLKERQEKARARAETKADASRTTGKKRQRESADGPADNSDPSSSSTSRKVQKRGQEDVHGSDPTPSPSDAPKTANSLDNQTKRRVRDLKRLRFRSSGELCEYRVFYKSSVLGTPAANVVPGSSPSPPPSKLPSAVRSLRDRHRVTLYGSSNVFLVKVKRNSNSAELEKDENETPSRKTFADGFRAALRQPRSQTPISSTWVATTSWSQAPARS